MNTRKTRSLRRLLFQIALYANYTDQIYQLEKAVARKPAKLQIEMVGWGEIPPDAVLLIRSILLKRSPHTQLITNARSSLQGASVLVWLLGDTRQIREDAKLFFRPPTNQEECPWKDEEEDCELCSQYNPEEADYAQVLQYINEYLPVKELAGQPIDLQVLKQFGLVDNEKRDLFLASAFGKSESHAEVPPQALQQKPIEQKPKVPHSDPTSQSE